MVRNDGTLDTETLGCTPNAPLKQIAVVLDSGEKFNRYILDSGNVGESDLHTIDWWRKQPTEVREHVMNNPDAVPLRQALEDFCDFIKMNQCTGLWAHATFDFPILQHKLDYFGMSMPITFRNLYDYRTIETILKQLHIDYTWTERKGNHHDALDDAVYQHENLGGMLTALRTVQGEAY